MCETFAIIVIKVPEGLFGKKWIETPFPLPRFKLLKSINVDRSDLSGLCWLGIGKLPEITSPWGLKSAESMNLTEY